RFLRRSLGLGALGQCPAPGPAGAAPVVLRRQRRAGWRRAGPNAGLRRSPRRARGFPALFGPGQQPWPVLTPLPLLSDQATEQAGGVTGPSLSTPPASTPSAPSSRARPQGVPPRVGRRPDEAGP